MIPTDPLARRGREVASGWLEPILIAVAVLAGGSLLALQVFSLAAPIVGEHHFRQAHTYSVAANFHDQSATFFLPRTDQLDHGATGIMGMEAPIYPYLTFLAEKVLGRAPQTARMVAWAIFVGGALVFARALREGEGAAVAGAVLLALLLSPMTLFEARQIQPDGPMAGFLLASAGLFYSFSRTGHRWEFGAGLAVFTAAALMKTTALLLAPALLAVAHARPAPWRQVLRRGLWFGVPVVLSLAWMLYSGHLNTVHNSGHATFQTTAPPWDTVRADLAAFDRHAFVFRFVLPSYWVYWGALPLLGIGSLLSLADRRSRRLGGALALWLLLGLSWVFPLARRYQSHWYYGLVVAVPLAYFVGLAIARAATSVATRGEPPRLLLRWTSAFTILVMLLTLAVGEPWAMGAAALGAASADLDRGWLGARGASLLAGAAVAALIVAVKVPWRRAVLGPPLVLAALAFSHRATFDLFQVFTHRAAFAEWSTYRRDWGSLPEAISRFAPPGEPIVANAADPWFLHLARRKGFAAFTAVITSHGAAHYRARGARLLLHLPGRDQRPDAALLGDRLRPLAQDRHWALFCLAEEGCPPLGLTRPATRPPSP